ncbi:MAG: hypothetical protein LBR16_00475 [Treponema sp.]|jgi:hypothetical protein|nr:hypothetical protein [Treponema sp.]
MTEDGIFLNGDDCRVLFPLLKRDEAMLPAAARGILLNIERVLYKTLSLAELEALKTQGKRPPPPASDAPFAMPAPFPARGAGNNTRNV